MAEITTGISNRKKTGDHKRSNRRSTRVDLTPMVDLGFLLITFFVFTTSLTESKVMNLVSPVDKSHTEVPESGSMTIIMGENDKIYYYYGKPDSINASTQMKATDIKHTRKLIVEKKHATDPDKLMFIIKADERSTFKNLIDMLDEMMICDIKSGHYAEVDITEEESQWIKKQ